VRQPPHISGAARTSARHVTPATRRSRVTTTRASSCRARPVNPNYYGIDQIGSVRRAFASTSSAPAYGYDPYGAPLQTTAPVTDFVYGGMFYDADSGLYLTKYRAYDPVSGRWLSRDRLGESPDPSSNLYPYVGGNPIYLRDPEGTIPVAPQALNAFPASRPDRGSGPISSSPQNTDCLPSVPTTGSLGEDIRLPSVSSHGTQIAGTPNTGSPGGIYINPGSGQIRLYGPDGYPVLDIDTDHSHGGIAPGPHIHIWTPNPDGGFPVRGPGTNF